MLFTKFAWTWPSGSGEDFFKNIVNVFLLFHIYLRLEKSVALHLNKLEFPTPKDALWQIWLKLAHAMVLKKKMKMWKFYRQTDRRTDGDRRRTTGDQESSLEQTIMGQVALSYSAWTSMRSLTLWDNKHGVILETSYTFGLLLTWFLLWISLCVYN